MSPSASPLRRCLSHFCLLPALVLAVAPSVLAAPPRALPAGKLPNDIRLKPLKDLNGYFPFQEPASPAAWPARRAELQRRILVANGLWPAPTKTPLNAKVHSPIEKEDYTVESVYFESMPGFYVTGSLYRPKGKQGPFPGVLCPHGHWANGRFYDRGERAILKEIVIGAERFEEGGRSPLQARCVQLARMGCVAFLYDMIGYADSQQLSFELVHRFADQRANINTLENWGFYGTQAEAHLQSVMGLQTWNSVRALDFLESLKDIDPTRLAITGSSGGGTQTMLLAAIDDRLALSMPAVMVSTAMQGGCTCESCSLLRVDGGNIDFAALFAPKPQGLTTADDWTKELSTKGFPSLVNHYEMLGAKQNIMLADLVHFKHNYNYPSRATMYSWFNKHFKLGLSEPVVEQDYDRLTTEELTVWKNGHEQPSGGESFERELLQWWHDDAQQQLTELRPEDAQSLKAYREVVGGGVDTVIGRGLPESDDLDYEATSKVDRGDYLEIVALLRDNARNAEIPTLYLYPKQWNGHAVIWLTPHGKAGLLTQQGEPIEPVARLVATGHTVIGVDLLLQGEYLADGADSPTRTRVVKNPRQAPAYTFGYNHSLFAHRVHDVLAVIAFATNHELTPETLSLVGIEGAGHWAAAARAQARETVDRAMIDTAGFRFGKLLDYRDPDFTPGGAKYFDLPGMLSLSAPAELMIAGENNKSIELVQQVYRAADAADAVSIHKASDEPLSTVAVEWLLGESP